MGAFERVLVTAPDRLARTAVHQRLLLEELPQQGGAVACLERPMRHAPPEHLRLHIRGAVAEYARPLRADRMRRGRQAQIRRGPLVPWTVPPSGDLRDPACPRDPHRLRLDPVTATVVSHIVAWDTAPQTPQTLYGVATRRSDVPGPTPMGTPRWNASRGRGLLGNPVYPGIAQSGKSRPVPARTRQSALRPVGPGLSHRPTPPEDWLPSPVPARISQETCEAAQARLAQNSHRAGRHTTAHQSLLRGVVSGGPCE